MPATAHCSSAKSEALETSHYAFNLKFFLAWPCADNHSFCELMCSKAMSCPEVSISTLFFYLFSGVFPESRGYIYLALCLLVLVPTTTTWLRNFSDRIWVSHESMGRKKAIWQHDPLTKTSKAGSPLEPVTCLVVMVYYLYFLPENQRQS